MFAVDADRNSVQQTGGQMSGSRRAPVHGAIGGVLAATAIVLFFLIVDAARGEVLQTPSFLASVLLGREGGGAGVGVILLYTLLHYAVFATVGALVAVGVTYLRAPATILLGLVLGFLLFDLVFYASVAVTGTNVVREIGWVTFLFGNLIAGVVLMVYLSRSGVARGRSLADALSEHSVIREGLIAGVLGGLAVAGWFFLVDLFYARLLYTPGALGSALFQGATSPGDVEVSAATVLGYSVVHFTGFIVVGLVFSALVTRAERNPPLLMGLVLLFVTFETLLLGLVAILAAWLLDVLPWWSIALSNIVAAAVMAFYLWRVHPRLQRDVAEAGDETLEARAGRS